ncbi:hypothetical protein FQZ97_693880 [compost metagenome]
MEFLVVRHVAREGRVVERGLAQQFVDAREAGARFAQHHGRRAALGRQPRHQAFERAAQLDGVGHVAFGKGAHRIAAVGQGFEQAFLLEPHERAAHRRARHAELFGDGDLGNARAAGQLARQDHFAQPQLRLHGLRAAAVAGLGGSHGGDLHHAACDASTGRIGIAARAGRSFSIMRSMRRRAHIEPASMLRL